MEALQPLTDMFGLNLIAIGAMSGFIYFWIKFLKSQFYSLKGIYTTLINFASSFAIVYAYQLKNPCDTTCFIMSAIAVWIFSVAGHANHKSASNGGFAKPQPAFKIHKVEDGKEE